MPLVDPVELQTAANADAEFGLAARYCVTGRMWRSRLRRVAAEMSSRGGA
ncbi:MAG: hypothetical protein HYR51_18675 [Candidatus Rokubacteria bacterium]|nr:hypothetical protein [Candidatus Rokubacteria bacterium]